MKDKKHYYGIDLLKGLLILLVIIGHVLQQQDLSNFLKYMIYSFHIPLFLSVSGFLIKKKQLESISLKDIIKKYLRRIIIPFLIAVISFYLVLALIDPAIQMGLTAFILHLLVPYGHLWYIPALLGMIFILWISLKIKISEKIMLIAFLAISIIWLVVLKWEYFHTGLSGPFNVIKPVWTRIISYFIFFYIGFFYRNHLKENIPKNISLIFFIALITLITARIMLYRPTDYFYNSDIVFVLLNVFLIFLTLDLFSRIKSSLSKFIEWMGQYSLPIYLWHYMVYLLAYRYILDNVSLMMFYVINLFLIICIFIPGMYLLSKLRLIKVYVFGDYK